MDFSLGLARVFGSLFVFLGVASSWASSCPQSISAPHVISMTTNDTDDFFIPFCLSYLPSWLDTPCWHFLSPGLPYPPRQYR